MMNNVRAAAVTTLLSLAAILLPPHVMAVLSAPGTAPVSAVTRNNNGDLFSAPGDVCNLDTCVGLSSGTASAAPMRPSDGRSCTCRCLDHLPAYRDDLHICVDDIHECALAPFVSGSTSQQIPYVFLPLKGQIIHPSKEISFAGVKTPVCAVSGAQFLTDGGWIELRNHVDNDVPFRLFRDEGRTFLQWLGDPDLRVKMSGRLILVQMLCKDLAKDPAATDLRSIFTPCVAFRVAGTPTKYISNVSEVIFAPDAHASNGDSVAGLTVSEYIAIGICSILLGLIYVASVFLYLHIRKRRKLQSLENDLEKHDDQSLAPGEEGIVKNNPLLSLGRHFTGPDNAFSDSGSSDDLPPDILQHQDDTRKKGNLQVTSAIIHPLNDNFSMALCPVEPMQIQDSSSIERLPEENVSIVETLECREERPETVKTIVSATTRRKLYFNPAYFEPHLLLAPPPAAIEFLTKIREVIAIAKHKMASKRFTPSLLGIPEEDSNHSTDHMYEFSLGPASSRRGSIISLKRENSRRRLPCSGCPGCEPNDLKSLCGKLPEFPSIAVCQSCSITTSSSVSESKQQSIRKWLEDVPILKVSNEDDEEISNTSIKSIRDMPLPATPDSYRKLKSSTKSNSSNNSLEKKSYLRSKSPVDYENLSSERCKSPIKRSPKPLPSPNKTTDKTKSPPRQRPIKARAPPPPVQTSKIMKITPKLSEDINPNITNHYDVIRHVKPPSPKPNLPPPDMINEAMVVDQAEDVPQVTKQKMAAVISEFSTHVGIDNDKVKSNNLKQTKIEYETDSLERNGKPKNGYSTPTDYGDVSSSQPSPSLSTALPMDEELTMQNAIVNVNSLESQTTPADEEHEYELIVLKKQDKKPLIDILDKKLSRLPELLQRNNGYNLVSEVYVNNGYNFGSSPSTPTDSNTSTLENQKPKIRYEQPEDKPGHLTIEVEDCPDNYIRVDDSDSFEPDTLDRKSTKFKLSSSSSGTFSSDYVDSLERPKQILLKTTGSFKSDTLNNASEIGFALNSNFNRFGSLREIYEAKTRNYLRPSLDSINFINPIPIHSPSDTMQKKLSWSKYKEAEEGRILTLEERQKKRQRPSPKGTIRQIPPDVIPPTPIPTTPVDSPIYEQPKPPRKVIIEDKFKPPLPPKNGIGRNTSLKINSTHQQKHLNISSPSSKISFKLSSSPSGVSARSVHSSDGENYTKEDYRNEDKSILKNFIHSDDVVFRNGINNQFILHAKTITPQPVFHEPFILNSKYDTIKMSPNIMSNYSYAKSSDHKNEEIKKTWRKVINMTSHQHKEDSGYLSTDSNESNKKKKEIDKESETDESFGDGHSESGAESIETHSVFFGTYRKLSRVAESIDSGVGSDSFKADSIVLCPGIRQCSS